VKKRVLGVALLAAALLVPPALAQMQQVLSIVVNGVALQGKALTYKGRIYVAVEDLAQATGGTYQYNSTTHVMQATIPQGGVARPVSAVRSGQRPWIKVVSEKKYVYADNAIVYATLKNASAWPALNVEVSCIFRGEGLRELGQSVQKLPVLQPGEQTTLEFRLFESANMQSYGPLPPEGSLVLNGSFTPISHNLKMNYQ
jgi:hypothetical protein